MANDNNKDIANSLSKLTEYSHKGTDLLLDSAETVSYTHLTLPTT